MGILYSKSIGNICKFTLFQLHTLPQNSCKTACKTKIIALTEYLVKIKMGDILPGTF